MATGTITDVTDGSRVIQQGIMPYRITLTDTCQVGDLIGVDGDDWCWYRADAGEKRYAEFVAGEKCDKSGNTITVFRQAIVSGLTLGSPGDPVYCGNTTAGKYEDIPDAYGYQQLVGFCLSTTEVYLCPNAAGGVFASQRESRGFAGYIRSEANSCTTTDIWGGLRIDVKSLTAATTGEVYGLYLFLQLADTNNHAGAFIRLEDGCSTSCHPDSFISFISGAVGPDYIFDLGSDSSPTGGAWAVEGGSAVKTTASGYLRLNVGEGVKYINVYSG